MAADHSRFPFLPDLQQPNYPELILAAVEAINDPNGSSEIDILVAIESGHPDLPLDDATLLSHHLNLMKESGQLLMLENNNYIKPPGSRPPVKRGRGRPPKPKADQPAGAVASSPKPRGRPPKARDPFAAAALPKNITAEGSGKPRGRPPKKLKTNPTPPAAEVGHSPRGRGRPPKVKAAVAPVGC